MYKRVSVGWWLLRLMGKILANLRLSVNICPLWSTEKFLRLIFFSTKGYNLSIFTPNGLSFWSFYGSWLTPKDPHICTSCILFERLNFAWEAGVSFEFSKLKRTGRTREFRERGAWATSVLKISTMPRVLALEEIEIVVTHAPIHNETMFCSFQENRKCINHPILQIYLKMW